MIAGLYISYYAETPAEGMITFSWCLLVNLLKIYQIGVKNEEIGLLVASLLSSF